jgi:hypothetical protein
LSETDIREYVKRRKISGGTRSEAGRRDRDTFASLKKTCRKLSVSFWVTCTTAFANSPRFRLWPRSSKLVLRHPESHDRHGFLRSYLKRAGMRLLREIFDNGCWRMDVALCLKSGIPFLSVVTTAHSLAPFQDLPQERGSLRRLASATPADTRIIRICVNSFCRAWNASRISFNN